MNSKRETVEQAIRDLRDHQEHLEIAYNQYLDNELEDYVEVMDKFYDERVNIATNLFKDFSMKPRPEGTLYRRPESSPPFKSGDFRSSRGKKPLPYPMIIGRATKRMSGVPRLIARIDHFIKQLDAKLKNRKDLQESSPFQLTEAKLKQIILEVMMEQVENQEQPQQLEIQQLESIKTVKDFFTEMEKFETLYKQSLSTKRGLEFTAGLVVPGYGTLTHFDDAAQSLAEMLEHVNAPGGQSLFEYEAKFPLLAFLDLDPLIEKNVSPEVISKWIKQLDSQLTSAGLTESSPMPSADELFLGWYEKQPEVDVIASAFREAINRGKIALAPSEYEKKRQVWNSEQKKDLAKTTADPTEKLEGFKRLFRAIGDLFSKSSEATLQKHKADAQRFSSQSPQFFESKK